MQDNPYGQPSYVPPPAAPPPGYQGAVWPPPPTAQTPGVPFPFKTQFNYAEGSVPNFRNGNVWLAEQGIMIQGKATPRYEIQVPVLIVSIILGAGWLLAYLIMEYAIRTDEALNVAWNQVRRIILVPKKQRVCIVYDAPNYKGIMKTFSLTFRLDKPLYDSFVETVHQYLPDRVAEGKLRAWTSPVVWIVCIGILLAIAFLVLMVFVGSHSPSPPS